jgi:hypothetical protein
VVGWRWWVAGLLVVGVPVGCGRGPDAEALATEQWADGDWDELRDVLADVEDEVTGRLDDGRPMHVQDACTRGRDELEQAADDAADSAPSDRLSDRVRGVELQASELLAECERVALVEYDDDALYDLFASDLVDDLRHAITGTEDLIEESTR